MKYYILLLLLWISFFKSFCDGDDDNDGGGGGTGTKINIFIELLACTKP